MIGQRDNHMNIEIGDASKKIAEASLRDNAAMKAMAEDSKKVGLLSRRDSNNMRIVSVVTLFFLPGTFTAVCSLLIFCRVSQYQLTPIPDSFQHQLLRLSNSR